MICSPVSPEALPPTSAVWLILLVLTSTLSPVASQSGLLIAAACYGNINNYLRLDCGESGKIQVINVYHGTRAKSYNCTSPASVDTYNKECCNRIPSDCMMRVADSAYVVCNNNARCTVASTWSNANKECDQDTYPQNSNYMLMEYRCLGITTAAETTTTSIKTIDRNQLITNSTTAWPTTAWPTTAASTTESTTVATNNKPTGYKSTLLQPLTTQPPTHPFPTPLPTDQTPSQAPTQQSTVARNSTGRVYNHTQPALSAFSTERQSAKSEEELSNAMVGAIIGGSLGMFLTLVAFIFYWGRKRHLRIVGKPQPTVWDYLLSQTFTVRGSRGYDHFSSVRSSASSDGEAGSPVVRKNMWLPNIVHREDTAQDDAISNYDNETDRHRVEVHPRASPTPYAFVNLYVDAPSTSQGYQGHHEA
ncbi:uncharacterized protein LOC131953633 [Physella acuta]|uniref:uncharacterized protein LOC131953633 n=1 Tax=Physella acuta TaxID=109671 RepID=UPI0027DC859D|nr:uncharacterized protein LOC131953633 [Physella acuta]